MQAREEGQEAEEEDLCDGTVCLTDQWGVKR